jgi:type I restriction enzyme S subunit
VKADTVRLKFICHLGYGDALPKDDVSAGDIPVFGSNGQYTTTTERNTGAPAIVVGRKGSYGKVNWTPVECFASDTTFFIDNRFTSSNLRWLYWTLQTLRLDEGSQEAAVPGLNRESVYEQRVVLPASEDQRRIADYLDRETARIDALVAEKECMLALLEEKHTALISRAVTRGLDSNVPLKPSGLDWLGDIPAHWDVLRIKHGFRTIGSGTTPPTNQEDLYDGDVPWVTTSELRENVVTSTEKQVSEDALRELSALKLYSADTVLFAMYGATIGRVAILGVEATVNQAVCALADADRFFGQYVFYALLATRETLISLATGGGQPNLNAEKVREHKLPCPPIKEQRAIAEFLRREIARSEKISTEIKYSIVRIKERRAALITAAVTGQISTEEMTA